jgi:hypothetical protein
MKIFSLSLGTAAVLSALITTGCNTAGHYEANALRPGVALEAPHEVQVGESQRVVAHTTDLAAAKSIQWVSDTPGVTLQPEGQFGNQSAMFRADHPGKYIVRVRIDPGNGALPVEKEAAIDVVGRVAENR